MKTYLGQISRFLLLLLAIQIVRGLIITGLWRLLKPALNSPIWAIMDILAFGLVGMSFVLFSHPSRTQLSLDWKTTPRWELMAYIGMGILIVALVVSTYFLQPDLFILNLNAAIVIPIFEELLFRGWGWGQLEKGAPFQRSGVINWLVISMLFALWHFGYMDVYLLRVAPSNPNMNWGIFFVMKLLTTFLIGLIVGIPRWRTGRIYGSLILHSLINIFGR